MPSQKPTSGSSEDEDPNTPFTNYATRSRNASISSSSSSSGVRPSRHSATSRPFELRVDDEEETPSELRLRPAPSVGEDNGLSLSAVDSTLEEARSMIRTKRLSSGSFGSSISDYASDATVVPAGPPASQPTSSHSRRGASRLRSGNRTGSSSSGDMSGTTTRDESGTSVGHRATGNNHTTRRGRKEATGDQDSIREAENDLPTKPPPTPRPRYRTFSDPLNTGAGEGSSDDAATRARAQELQEFIEKYRESPGPKAGFIRPMQNARKAEYDEYGGDFELFPEDGREGMEPDLIMSASESGVGLAFSSRRGLGLDRRDLGSDAGSTRSGSGSVDRSRLEDDMQSLSDLGDVKSGLEDLWPKYDREVGGNSSSSDDLFDPIPTSDEEGDKDKPLPPDVSNLTAFTLYAHVALGRAPILKRSSSFTSAGPQPIFSLFTRDIPASYRENEEDLKYSYGRNWPIDQDGLLGLYHHSQVVPRLTRRWNQMSNKHQKECRPGWWDWTIDSTGNVSASVSISEKGKEKAGADAVDGFDLEKALRQTLESQRRLRDAAIHAYVYGAGESRRFVDVSALLPPTASYIGRTKPQVSVMDSITILRKRSESAVNEYFMGKLRKYQEADPEDRPRMAKAFRSKWGSEEAVEARLRKQVSKYPSAARWSRKSSLQPRHNFVKALVQQNRRERGRGSPSRGSGSGLRSRGSPSATGGVAMSRSSRSLPLRVRARKAYDDDQDDEGYLADS